MTKTSTPLTRRRLLQAGTALAGGVAFRGALGHAAAAEPSKPDNLKIDVTPVSHPGTTGVGG